MPVSPDMVVFPRVARPILLMNEDWKQFADKVGATAKGVDSLTAHYVTVLGDHVGTHMDAMKHIVPTAPGPEGIPLQYCHGNGVRLDFRHLPSGAGITVADLETALQAIDYEIQPLDIVFIWTGAGSYNNEERYVRDHCGMTREATLWLIERGVKVMGIDAITFDPPIWAMFERNALWEAHRVMWEAEYYHLENLCNLEALPSAHGFTAIVLPIKWVGTTGAPVRAVAVVDQQDLIGN